MAAYIVFRVETKTNIPVFRKTFFSVQRRFSDFLGLHEKLVEKYLRLGRIIPPAPEKSVIGKKYYCYCKFILTVVKLYLIPFTTFTLFS